MPTTRTTGRAAGGQNHQDTATRIAKIRHGLLGLQDQLREDVHNADDPRAQALFETTAEVVGGLANAFVHYEEGK